MSAPQIDVAVITMKEEEYVAALDAFASNPALVRKGKRRDYDVSCMETSVGPCHVAITRCIQQGNAHAQNAASDIINDLTPAFIMVVGIAGGVPTPDFTLGDVILSSYIHDLTLEDTGTGTSRFNALGGPLHSNAARVVERLQAIMRSVATPSLRSTRPDFDGHHTTGKSDWNKTIDDSFRYHRDRGRVVPILRAERIASSDRLVKDPELIDAWRHVIKGIACAEMESAGVYVVCQRQDVPVLAIRGISDIIGWKRDETWTLYACESAARFASAIVSSGALRRSSAANLEAVAVPSDKILSATGQIVSAVSPQQPLSRRKASLAVVDVAITNSSGKTGLEIKLRNNSDEVAFIKAVECVTVARWNLPRPGARPSAVPVSAVYDIDVAPSVGEKSVYKMSQVVKPNDVDRFVFSLGSQHRTYPFIGLFAFLLDIRMVFNEDDDIVVLPRTLLHLPSGMDLLGMFQGRPSRHELEQNQQEARDALAVIRGASGMIIQEDIIAAFESWEKAEFDSKGSSDGNSD